MLNENLCLIGQRWSTASAYLRPALSRPNLSIEENTLVTKVLFKGPKAIGIEYVKDGEKKRVRIVIYCLKRSLLKGKHFSACKKKM